MDRHDHRTISVGLALSLAVACGGGKPEGQGSPAPPAGAASPAPECAVTTAVPVKIFASSGITWKDGVAQARGSDPAIIYDLPPRSGACGVRLRFVLTTPDARPAFFQVFWTAGGRPFGEQQQGALVPSSAEEQTFTVWIDGDIDRLRVDPDTKPATFKLLEIVVLTRRR